MSGIDVRCTRAHCLVREALMNNCRPAGNGMYFVVLFRMSLGSDLNITIPRHYWAALRRDANGSPAFHFNDAELARSIGKDAIASYALMPYS